MEETGAEVAKELDLNDPAVMDGIEQWSKDRDEKKYGGLTEAERKRVELVRDRQERTKRRQKEYRNRPEVKAKRDAYNKRPEVIEARKIAAAKYSAKPHVKAKRRAYAKEYYQRVKNDPEYKGRRKKYNSPKKKAERAAYRREYMNRPNVRARDLRQRKARRKEDAQLLERARLIELQVDPADEI